MKVSTWIINGTHVHLILDYDEISESKLRMNNLSRFVSSRVNVLAPLQVERYEMKKSPKEILHFIKRGSGMGTEAERYARFEFESLGKRAKGDTKKKSGYDQLHLPTNQKAEQKTAGNWDENDKTWTWQHIEPNHNWQFLLLCGIGYHDIQWFFMPRYKVLELCEKNVIQKQGNKAGESYLGWWVSYRNIKHDLIEITSNEHLDELVSTLPK